MYKKHPTWPIYCSCHCCRLCRCWCSRRRGLLLPTTSRCPCLSRKHRRADAIYANASDIGWDSQHCGVASTEGPIRQTKYTSAGQRCRWTPVQLCWANNELSTHFDDRLSLRGPCSTEEEQVSSVNYVWPHTCWSDCTIVISDIIFCALLTLQDQGLVVHVFRGVTYLIWIWCDIVIFSKVAYTKLRSLLGRTVLLTYSLKLFYFDIRSIYPRC